MKKLFYWIKDNPNRTMFLVPILLVAAISISHVVTWYDIANPISWAIYLSIAIEVGAMTALVAATNKIKGGVWFMFVLVTIIQMIGNIFYSFKEIDVNGELFKSWVELTSPIWELMGSEPNDIISQKRWLSFLEGGLLPIISLTSLHFFTKYDRNQNSGQIKEEPIITKPDEDITDEEYLKFVQKFISQKKQEEEKIKYTPTERDLKNLNNYLNSFKQKESIETEDFISPKEDIKEIEVEQEITNSPEDIEENGQFQEVKPEPVKTDEKYKVINYFK